MPQLSAKSSKKGEKIEMSRGRESTDEEPYNDVEGVDDKTENMAEKKIRDERQERG